MVTESEIQSVGLAKLPFVSGEDPATNITVQVPNVARSSVRSGVRLAKGESLLIVSPTTYPAEDAAKAYIAEVEKEMGLPTTDPFRFGAGNLVDAMLAD